MILTKRSLLKKVTDFFKGKRYTINAKPPFHIEEAKYKIVEKNGWKTAVLK